MAAQTNAAALPPKLTVPLNDALTTFKIVAVADIPRTKSGKITELAVRDVVHGRVVKNKEALANPEALDTVFGSAALGKRSGVLGAVTDHLEIWTKSGTGQLARRLDNVQVQQKDLTQRRDRLDELFNVNYERYLLQFSQLQTVLGQMNQTSGLFGQLGAA
mgnify:CR=1 FL=1